MPVRPQMYVESEPTRGVLVAKERLAMMILNAWAITEN
jgi:hypothetical protein